MKYVHIGKNHTAPYSLRQVFLEIRYAVMYYPAVMHWGLRPEIKRQHIKPHKRELGSYDEWSRVSVSPPLPIFYRYNCNSHTIV